VIVVASIALEKVAVGLTVVATPVAASAGVFAVTVGAPLIVVNVQLAVLARATPSGAMVAAVRVAV
jgi:hypothetical protein